MNNASTEDGKQELIKKGDLLIVQGEKPSCIHYLTQGSLEILSAPKEYDGLERSIILSKSKRVGTITGKSLISGLSMLFSEPYRRSIRAIEDSYVVKYPIKEGGFKQLIEVQPSLGLKIIQHLAARIDTSLSDNIKYIQIYQNLCRINDNIALMLKSIPAVENQLPDKILNKGSELYNIYKNNGGEIPSRFDAKFLISNNSHILKKNYNFPGMPLESYVDKKQCDFFKQFLKLNPEIFKPIIRSDPSIFVYMYETLSENLIKIFDRLEAVHTEIDEEISSLFGDDGSLISFFIDAGGYKRLEEIGAFSPDFLKNFLSLAVKIHSFYEDLSGEKLIDKYSGFKKIHDFYQSQKSGGESSKGEAAAPVRRSENLGKYNKSMQQIFEFALVDKEFRKKFLKMINDFKNMKNPFNTEPEGRKARRGITKQYWELFKQVYIRSKSENVIPDAVKLLLNYGYLDEDLIEESQLAELDELLKRSEEHTKIPIYTEDEFLNQIYNGEIIPSITEMGLTYEASLREESKHTKKEKELRTTKEDEFINKVVYEIAHRTQTTVAVCSGSTSTAFPILTSLMIKSNFMNLYTSKKKLEATINSVREIDYSVFYRETVLKLGEKRELIEEEIIPNFVLLPSFGTKTMLWQDLDGINRRTRGRIVVPTFFMGDLLKNIAHTLACFRYELNRTIKGAMWRDPVEGGLTGIYLDYVQFYKKNPKLSIEMKEKITEKFKSLRDDRSRFANDYILWILYEKDGIPKLNNIVRDIFYKNIPFKKEIRSKLENMPTFSEIATRFKNVHTRNITSFERRFKKYRDAQDNLPKPLQKYLDYLNK